MLRIECEFISHGRSRKDRIHTCSAKQQQQRERNGGAVGDDSDESKAEEATLATCEVEANMPTGQVFLPSLELTPGQKSQWRYAHAPPPPFAENIFISSGLLGNVAADKSTENISGSAFSELGNRDSLSEPSSTFFDYHFLKACYL